MFNDSQLPKSEVNYNFVNYKIGSIFYTLNLGNCRDNLGPRRSLASNKRQSSLEDPSSGKCLSEDGAAVVRQMSGDASEKSDVTSESMPPNATNTPGQFWFSIYYKHIHGFEMGIVNDSGSLRQNSRDMSGHRDIFSTDIFSTST